MRREFLTKAVGMDIGTTSISGVVLELRDTRAEDQADSGSKDGEKYWVS